MPTPFDVRREHFAHFVQRAVDRAKTSRGWSVEKISSETERLFGKGDKVGTSTIYRWLRKELTSAPKPEQVLAFCMALGIPRSIPFDILWPDDDTKPVATAPLPVAVSPAIDEIQRKLSDPAVSAAEKYLINQMLESLAGRPNAPRDPQQ